MPTTKPQASESISALKLFARSARTGSFTKAARELGLSQPSASRIVSALEKELGAALFVRNSRAVTLTEAGVDYLARVEPILDALDEANHSASGSTQLRGSLRVGLSSSFAIRAIIPVLPRFMSEHPDLRLDLQMSDQRQDLILEGVDVALRLGALPDSGATARKIMEAPRGLFASPAYLAAAGPIVLPSDLAHHHIITGPATAATPWKFRKGATVETIAVRSRLNVTVNEGALAAAVAGLGIVSTGMIEPFSELQQGLLTPVLGDWEMERIPIHAVYAAGRAAKPAARVFTQFLIDEFKAQRSHSLNE